MELIDRVILPIGSVHPFPVLSTAFLFGWSVDLLVFRQSEASSE